MSSPNWEPYSDDELLHTGRLVPVHPLTRGLQEHNARTIIKTVVERAAPLLPEYLPEPLRQRLGLLPLSTAIAQMHFPDSHDLLQQARTRLAFDEFLLLQLYVVQRKKYWQGEMGYSLPFYSAMHQELLAQLPFELTGAQQRVLNEIFSDMQRYVPMARLLQGDVGSGKTIVAAAALLQAIANGFQGALMAPTQILAEQHHRGLQQLLGRVRLPRKAAQQVPAADAAGDAWDATLAPERREELNKLKQLLDMMPEDDLNGAGVRVGLLKGRLGKKDRQRVLDAIEKGDVDLIVGTHALITEGVHYSNLGMVCIDEQHRFGVEQRERLKQKSNGIAPHMLVMTATPIPRTLTLTIYGELDTSLLDELPPGRQQIQTRWITSTEYPKAYHHIRKEIAKGRQAFVICPLVEESDKVDLPSAEETYEYLQHDVFPDLRVGLIHGRMLPREKDQMMRAFGNHEYDILVATAVVEVGIDVPNATIMMIEGAERFGLAQLHQFRGRVGRGSHRSYCILVSDAEENEVTRQRLEAMEQIHDGFKLAEIDLELRGPGEFFGKRQSGTPDLKVASLADIHLLQRARREAEVLLEDDPELSQPEHTLLREKVRLFWEHAQGAS
jgi:ATP-dependent DNA helicase RecG